MTKVLIVEDNEHKRGKIMSLLLEEFPLMDVSEAYSFTSGCQAIDSCFYDLVLMDMSLPTHDKSPTDSGGRFRAFGGREIARKVIRRGLATRLLFITQYDSFSDKVKSLTLATLADELERECGANYFGVVHYDSSKSAWREQLNAKLSALT